MDEEKPAARKPSKDEGETRHEPTIGDREAYNYARNNDGLFFVDDEGNIVGEGEQR